MSPSSTTRRFFAILPPGLEEALELELRSLIEAPEEAKIRRELGGVSYSVPLEQGINILHMLRTPSKVLLRLGTKKIRRMVDIETLLERAELSTLIPAGARFSIEIHTHSSKLHRSDVLKSKCTRVLKALLAGPHREEPEQKFQLRLINDLGTLSLQLNGPPLYQRGWRALQGKASLRENLAASLLLLSGWDPREPLLDPFCGSGTIPIEAARMAKNFPPRLSRSDSWQYLLPLRHFTPSTPLSSERTPLVFGRDQQQEAIDKSIHNAQLAEIDADFEKKSITALAPPCPTGIIITNPPYGLRLGKNVDSVYKKLGERYRDSFQEWKLFFITPHQRLAKLVDPNVESIARFPQGGLWVDFYKLSE